MTGTTETRPEQPPAGQPEGQGGGIRIDSGRDTNVKGDVVAGNKTTTTTTTHARPPAERTGRKTGAREKSSWANGLFYLFAFVVIVAVLAWFAQRTEALTLTVIAVVGLLAVPLIGALQLRMDGRLKEKSMMELIKMVLEQLPLVGKLIKP